MKIIAIMVMAIMVQGCFWGTAETNAVKTVVTTGLVTNSVNNVSDDILKAKKLEAEAQAVEAGKDNKANIAITEAIKRLPIPEQGQLIKLAIYARVEDIKADKEKHIATQRAKRPRWFLFGFLSAVALFCVLWAAREYFRKPKKVEY